MLAMRTPALAPAGRSRLFLGGNFKCKCTRASIEGACGHCLRPVCESFVCLPAACMAWQRANACCLHERVSRITPCACMSVLHRDSGLSLYLRLSFMAALAADMNALESEFPKEVEIVLFVPFVYIDLCQRVFAPRFAIGAQNAFDAGPMGEHTGAVTMAALADCGVGWVLLGHSDRRNALKEEPGLIAEKAAAAVKAGLLVNFTFGETKAQREKGEQLAAIDGQIEPLGRLLNGKAEWEKLTLAYEPVWAIGDGATPCSPKDAQVVHAHVREWIRKNVSPEAADLVRIAYTGSVSPTNATGFSATDDIDGFVCGRASLVADDFLAVAQCRDRA